MSAPKVTVAVVDDDPSVYEEKHVHSVYDQIAPHFSTTRYKPWPIVSRFLSDIPTGWVGLDSGTGNGKYLPLPLERSGAIWTIGLDRSKNLLSAARQAGNISVPREVIWGDVLGKSWRSEAFDYAISIATIHHLATNQRRQKAIERLLDCVSSKHGRVLIYVWAVEQDHLSKRTMPIKQTTTVAGDCGLGQDVFVPWVLTGGNQLESGKSSVRGEEAASANHEAGSTQASQRFLRYYHLFAEGELQSLVEDAARALGLLIGKKHTHATGESQGIEFENIGWERSNHYIEIRRWQASG